MTARPRDYVSEVDWTEAAREFTRSLYSQTRSVVLTVDQVAASLAGLADLGYIISPVDHNRLCDSYAAQLNHAHTAADELVRRLEDGGDQ